MGYKYISLIFLVFAGIISCYNHYQAQKYMDGYSFPLIFLSGLLLVGAIIFR